MVFQENISHQLDVIGGVKAHSIVFKGHQPTEPHAFFLAYHPNEGIALDPEIYPRASIASASILTHPLSSMKLV
jgi:hypothetical protein